MRTTPFSLALAALLAIAGPNTLRADNPDWFPFVIPLEGGPGVTDAGDLSPTPAGADGFIGARAGHFHDEKGRRVRFLGVNLCYNANFPHKADAARVAARLRSYGVNIVRLCSMDAEHAPRGIFDARYRDRQHLDAGQLDRLDYLVHQLKRHGIYVNIPLHVGRTFRAADGFSDTERLPPYSGVVRYFEPRMLDLQKKYARELLTHYNPYTKTRYTEEPAVAVIELTNEDSLVGAAWGDTFSKLPPRYRDELTRQWNRWLQARHKSTADLAKAWQLGAGQVGPELLRNGEFAAGAASWRFELNQGAQARVQVPPGLGAPPGVAGRVARLEVTRAGKQAWQAQFQQDGVNLTDGELYTVTFWARADRKRAMSVNALLDQADWRNVGLRETAQLTLEWQPFRFRFTATRAVEKHVRFVFGVGTATGTVDVAGVSLRSGSEETLPAGCVEKGAVPLGRPTDTPAGRDWITFLLDVERRYQEGMQTFVKKELGARASVTCSQASYGGLGGLYRERLSDYADMHAYWQHPEFPNRPWDAGDWKIGNTAMVRDRSCGALLRLARHRLAGMPFSVSEYNHAAPNDYQAECVPLLAAFAAYQDWDAIYLFDYSADRDEWTSNRIRGYFSINSNPAKTAFLPIAAMLFRRADLRPADAEARLLLPEDDAPALLTKDREPHTTWEAAKSPAQEAVTRRLAVTFVSGTNPATIERKGEPPTGGGPLRWEGTETDQALFTVDSPSSKVMVGFLGGRRLSLPGWQVEMTKTATGFAALTLSARDGRPADRSRSLLLTAVGRVENKGMGWNANRTSVGRAWGQGPTRAEGIPAAIALDSRAKSATVYALDGAGRRQGQVTAEVADGKVTFRIGPAYRTLWYEVVTDAEE